MGSGEGPPPGKWGRAGRPWPAPSLRTPAEPPHFLSRGLSVFVCAQLGRVTDWLL